LKLSYNDRQHAYWLDGKRCKGVTTVAKVPDDTYNLQNWQKRQVALGMAFDETLIERAIAHHDDKQALNLVAEDALRAAKSHQAAARGTAIHRTLERHDLGEHIIDTAQNRALRAAYDKALDAAGLTVLPQYIERIVVHPKVNVAGRLDRIFKRRRDGKYVIGDIKSGSNAVKYPQSTSVQLAMYAYAELMAGPIPADGGDTEEFEKLPEKLDLKFGYIVHAPDEHTVEIVKIDIARGWKIAQNAIFPILEWRNVRDLISPVGSQSVDDLLAPATEERVGWIRGRLNGITMVEDSADVKKLVALRWPAGVGKPKDPDTVWSENDIDELDAMLMSVEKDCALSFPTRNPAYQAMGSA
jgi:hypothetical protein